MLIGSGRDNDDGIMMRILYSKTMQCIASSARWVFAANTEVCGKQGYNHWIWRVFGANGEQSLSNTNRWKSLLFSIGSINFSVLSLLGDGIPMACQRSNEPLYGFQLTWRCPMLCRILFGTLYLLSVPAQHVPGRQNVVVLSSRGLGEAVKNTNSKTK